MRYLKTPKTFVCLLVIVTFGLALLYAVAQQSWRQGANLPQDKMAQAVANDLASGKKPGDLVSGYINISNSSAPFIIIYDQFGKVVTGNGYLDNRVPQVPVGVLAASKNGKSNAVTWQPTSNVRIASVSVHGGDYYVLGGRSLNDVEKHISSIGQLVVAAWVLSIVSLFAFYKLATKHQS